MEKVIRESGIQKKSTIFYKFVELLTYIVAGRLISPKEAFVSVYGTAAETGLKWNENQTKF